MFQKVLQKFLLISVLSITSAQIFAADVKPSGPPQTPQKAVENSYHETKVSDPYQWLENAKDPEVLKWTQDENAYTRAYLDQLPGLDKIRDQLQKWNSFEAPVYRTVAYRNGIYFALKLQPPKNQSLLVMLTSLDDTKSEKVLLDPNQIDSTGTTAIDFFQPSLDGKYIAVSLSKGGSEIGTLHIYETLSGKELPDQIPAVRKPTGAGDVTWNGDASGIYYTKYPSVGERPAADLDFFQQVYFHKLGTDIKSDTYCLGKDFPRIAEIKLETSKDGRYVVATVANGDGGEFAHYLLKLDEGPSGKWTQLTHFEDKFKKAVLGFHNDLYLVSIAGSPRGKILKMGLDQLDVTKAKVIVPESTGVVEEVRPTDSKLYVVYLIGGPSEIHVFDQNGKTEGVLPTAALSDTADVSWVTGDEVVFRSFNYIHPVTWYTANAGKVHKTALEMRSPVNLSDIAVRREFARSKDGTQVPVTVLYKKGLKRNGANPTILYAYGGYGISLTPRYIKELRMWFDHGGVYAVANIRGGGEFGEDWHLSGNLTHKQNVFDDFIACAEHMISAHYTNSDKLAIEGGSNGGLLMGAALTQRPELFKAVVSHVGIYDMLRVELEPNGAFNVTEFGTVKDPAQFAALYAYSPYHRVVDGKKYPDVMFLTGANDGRVNPYQSKKMTARLQNAGNPNTVLLRVTFDAGHGAGKSITQRTAEQADVYAFLFHELGMKY